MRNTLTIAGKAVQSYFVQPVAYVVLTVFLLLGGWFFFALLRLFAEEKRTGTFELLLTAPVRTGEIVAGKFIAAAVFALIMIALAWIFPLILIIYGNPEVGVMFAGYVAFAMLALSFVAVGLFTSSLTQNQIVAAISCFGILIFLYVISWPASAGGGLVWSLLKYLSLPEHFSTMVRGVIDTSG